MTDRQLGPAMRLRSLMAEPRVTLLPGCWDGISARLVAQAGFEAAHLSGFAVAASVLGQPDIGLLTLTEMADAAGRVADVLNLPLLADADTGYGNEFNVERTINLYVQRGVAGLHIEDQVMPKRCGHMAGKAVIDCAAMVSKLRAAVAERDRLGRDVVVVARTDAAAVEGFDAALERGRAYRDAGADALFVEALAGPDEVERVAETFSDVPLVYNASAARSPMFSTGELEGMGFRLVLAPIAGLLAGAAATASEFAHLRRHGPTDVAARGAMSYDQVLDLVGWPQVAVREQQYGTKRD